MTESDEHQIGYKVLRRGTPVVAADGSPVGKVARVLDNAREHIFDGLVIATDNGRRFVDAPEVDSITNKRVRLGISAADVAELPRERGMAGALGKRVRRTGRKWQRQFVDR